MAKPSLSSGEGPSRGVAVPPGDPRAEPAGKTGAAALSGQIARFSAAGLANVGVDLFVYSSLLVLGSSIPVAKAAAFACGATFAYFVNKNWTFRAGRGNSRQFAAFASLYAASMAVNVGANSAVIEILGASLFGKAAAYCVALLLSATMNFFGMRRILLSRRRADFPAVT